jgi:uncharacterized membrane protein YkvA (DUF1232 family)
MSEEKPKRSLRNIAPPPTGVIQDITQRIKLILRLLGDSRVSFWLKLLPLGSLAYLISPVDFLPGLLAPFFGALDDVAIVWAGLYMFIEMCPPQLVQEHLKAIRAVIPGVAEEVDPDEEVIDGESRDVD